MAKKKLISAAIVTGMAVSGAQAAHDDMSKAAGDDQGQVHQNRDRAQNAHPDAIIAEVGLDGSSDLIPSFYGGDAFSDQPDDVFGTPASLDVDLLHQFDGSDASLIHHDDIVVEAEEGATDDDWFQLAQTIYGGAGNDGIMTPGVRNNTRVPGINRNNIGSGVKAPSVGTKVTPRTVPNKSLQTRQGVRHKDIQNKKRK